MAVVRSPVIVGLGMTDLGKVFGRSAMALGAEAVRKAADDAGLAVDQIDGLLINPDIARSGRIGLGLQERLGLRDLRLLSEMQGYGSSAAGMIAYAFLAIGTGMASTVACVFASVPLQEGKRAGSAYRSARALPRGWLGLRVASGVAGANSMYALAARRHMAEYGTTSEHFGAVAVAQREWARLNPSAQMREPITVADHQRSRLVSDPFRLLDCCLVSNGAIAVILTDGSRAADLRRPPVHVLGWGQSHPGYPMARGSSFGLVSGAKESGRAALAMAGARAADVDQAQLYDCYTYTVVLTLEDYGFCGKGEGGEFVAGGATSRTGTLPVNTGGGQLSGYYMWGMTPVSEAVIQARGQAGERQAANNLVLVSGNGGVLDHHATLLLSPHER